MEGLLLDTHVWLWLAAGATTELKPKQRQIINQASAQSMLGIAAISLWEIAMLSSKERIQLGKPTRNWLEDLLHLPGVALKPLTAEITVESTQLEGFHGDPADRLIIATARIHQLTILTTGKKNISVC